VKNIRGDPNRLRDEMVEKGALQTEERNHFQSISGIVSLRVRGNALAKLDSGNEIADNIKTRIWTHAAESVYISTS
jgi:hypothetical protein